jgi:hypothetical protein
MDGVKSCINIELTDEVGWALEENMAAIEREIRAAMER